MMKVFSKATTLYKIITKIRNFPVYLMDYFGMKKGQLITYKLRNGIKYRVRGGATDRFIVNEVCIHNSYNPSGFKIKKDDIVVDIGAHIGIFTIMAAHYAKEGKVYSFEPVKHNFEMLKKNIALNNAKNVTAINKAASNKNGEMNIFVSKTRNKGQNSLFNLTSDQDSQKVRKQSFKEFLKGISRIDFLKMDCEGGEYEIFPSLSKSDFNKIKKISMEYHNYGEKRGEEIKEILEKNGFNVRIEPDGKKFGSIYAIKSGEKA